MLLLGQIIGETPDEKRQRECDDYFYSLLKPTVFWGKDGFTANHNKNFESACVIIAQNSSRNPKEFTTLEYMQTLEELRKQSEKYKK